MLGRSQAFFIVLQLFYCGGIWDNHIPDSDFKKAAEGPYFDFDLYVYNKQSHPSNAFEQITIFKSQSSSSAHIWLVHVLLSSSTVSSIGLELNCSTAINQKPYKIEFQEFINA